MLQISIPQVSLSQGYRDTSDYFKTVFMASTVAYDTKTGFQKTHQILDVLLAAGSKFTSDISQPPVS